MTAVYCCSSPHRDKPAWEGVDGTVLVAFFIYSFIFKSAIYLFYVENYTKGDNALQ